MAETLIVATLIGDVVHSKRHPDRRLLQERIVAALSEVDVTVPPVQPLQTTIGDEFQGAYATVSDAVRASLALRLGLLPSVDARFGLGFGAVTVFAADSQPVSQDGPAWWAARDAITEVHALSKRAGRARTTRTWFIDGTDDPARQELTAFVNAQLTCRDALLGHHDERGLRLLKGWLRGQTQSQLAEDLGISQPAVSQRLAKLGAHALREADRLLDELS